MVPFLRTRRSYYIIIHMSGTGHFDVNSERVIIMVILDLNL